MKERRDPRTIYYFRVASYFLLAGLIVVTGIFLFLIVKKAVTYWLKLDLNTRFEDAFELIQENYNIYQHVMTIGYTIRTLRNIYL